MIVLKYVCILLSLCCLVSSTENKVKPRSLGKGLGPRCNACPPYFCEDDPVIILGYCCGCEGLFDHRPIHCSPYTKCPPDTFLLCQDYQYKLRCCC